MTTWCIIPVRGGSTGVPGKNRRNLNGKPLVSYSIENTLKVLDKSKIYMASDDEELIAIGKSYGLNIFHLGPQTGKETLDDVVHLVVEKELSKLAKDDDLVLTIQATCPLLSSDTLNNVIKIAENTNDTVMTVTDSRHLYWEEKGDGIDPHYKNRVNRQELPHFYKETGAVIACKTKQILDHKTRITKNPKVVVTDKQEAIDIDDSYDFKLAELVLRRKKILIKADSSSKIGMGHLYRSATLAYELYQHDLKIVSNNSVDKKLSSSFFESQPYDFTPINSDSDLFDIIHSWCPDLVILDQLDTDEDYVKKIKSSGIKVICFEDMGKGANHADLLISDLYENTELKHDNQLNGFSNSIINQTFEWVEGKQKVSSSVDNILILFGGTDPSSLGQLTLSALKNIEYKGEVTLIQGLGNNSKIQSLEDYGLKGQIFNNIKYMPKFMKNADLAISSAGRSISELIVCGTPTICLCQNEKELTHTHASQMNGILNLGLGKFLNEKIVSHYIDYVIKDYNYREKMQKRMIKSVGKRKNNRDIIKRASEIIGLELF